MSVRRRRPNRGLIRDREGVVLARTAEHPLAYLFEAIPSYDPASEKPLPPMHMPPEMRQIIAIHVFDNLKCGGPGEDAVYRLVKNKTTDAPMGLAGAMWVPKSVPDDVFEPEPVADDGVDVDALSEAQLNALQAKIDQRRVDEAHRQAADVPVADDAPEWVRYREQRLARIESELAESDAATERQDRP
ncbi:MAG: hypothetical protein QM658_09650 [Gordonia sp. (in: high G+C Gram-positive bacteria)]